MKFTDSDLHAVAESRMFNTKLRWGIKRGNWNFIYSMLPLILFTLIVWILPIELRGYFLAVAAVAALVVSVVTTARMKKLIQDEYEYIKVKYEEGKSK